MWTHAAHVFLCSYKWCREEADFGAQSWAFLRQSALETDSVGQNCLPHTLLHGFPASAPTCPGGLTWRGAGAEGNRSLARKIPVYLHVGVSDVSFSWCSLSNVIFVLCFYFPLGILIFVLWILAFLIHVGYSFFVAIVKFTLLPKFSLLLT